MWDEQFEALLRKHLPYLPAGEALVPATNLRDQGLDSMGTVELLADLERTYRVRFVDDLMSMESFETAGVLWRNLSGLTRSAA
jgi:acyl carrier protein